MFGAQGVRCAGIEIVGGVTHPFNLTWCGIGGVREPFSVARWGEGIACVPIPQNLSLVLSLASKKEHHSTCEDNSAVCVIGTFFRKESTQRNMWRNRITRT
jgi:hypothetical protein